MTPRHGQASRRRWTLTITTHAILFTLTFFASAAGLIYHETINNTNTITPTTYLTQPRPQPTYKPSKSPSETTLTGINILIIGSDERPSNSPISGMRADTTMILHIPADTSSDIMALSIPRDSWVDIPPCYVNDNLTTPATTTKFNAAFAYGGQTGNIDAAVACTIATIEHNTNIFIHEAAVIDFDGFTHIIDDLGGVEITINSAIESPKAGNLKLQPGTHLLDGETALKYARARSGEGLDGSDTSRIDRQQQLSQSVFHKAKSKYRNPIDAYNVFRGIAPHLYLSPGLTNLHDASALAWRIISEGMGISFTTIPWEPRGDGANVVWKTPEAEKLFAQFG